MRSLPSLIAFGVLSLVGLRAVNTPLLAQDWPPTMSFSPARPTAADLITIRVAGEWHDACVPNGSHVLQTDPNTILFNVFWQYPHGTVCATVMTPWARSGTIGPLAAGVYDVVAKFNGPWAFPGQNPIVVGGFTVLPAWPDGDTNCDGVVDQADIVPFITALAGQAAYDARYPEGRWLNADCNRDGRVDYGDINAFVASVLPHTDQDWVSPCLRSERADFCPGDDQLILTVEARTLHVVHTNVEYNCYVRRVAIALTMQAGNVIRLDEEAAEGGATCVCCREMGTTVVNLPAGTYTVQFCWQDYPTGPRCVEQAVVVPD